MPNSLSSAIFRMERRFPPWARRAWPAYLLVAIFFFICVVSVIKLMSFSFDLMPKPATASSPSGETIGTAVKVEGGYRKVYRAEEKDGQIQIIVQEVTPAPSQ